MSECALLLFKTQQQWSTLTHLLVLSYIVQGLCGVWSRYVVSISRSAEVKGGGIDFTWGTGRPGLNSDGPTTIDSCAGARLALLGDEFEFGEMHQPAGTRAIFRVKNRLVRAQ